MKRINMMRCPMDSATMNETVDIITQRIDNKQFTQHVVVNVAKIVNMQSDPELDDSVRNCDIINIDGMGVVWGAKWLGFDVPERVAGIDLFFALNQKAQENGYPVYFLGATEAVAEKATCAMQARYPELNIAGFHHGYFWDNEESVVNAIRESGAKLLFVAITSPKKERFIHRWQDKLGVTFVMGIGGTLDIVAGQTQRAPLWMQNAGLEWLYRLLQEPQRMWKRYLHTNSRFLWMLIKEKFGSSKQ